MGSLVQEVVANTGNTGTDRPAGAWSGPALASTTSGNHAVLCVEMDGSQTAAPTVTDTGTTWTLKLADTAVRQAIYVSAALTGAGLAPTITTSSATNIGAVISEWSGLSGSIGGTAVDSSLNTVKGKTLTVTVGAASSTVIWCGQNDFGSTGLTPAGSSLIGTTSTGGVTATSVRLSAAYDNPGAAGSLTVGWSGEATFEPEAMLAVEFTAASGGGSASLSDSIPLATSLSRAQATQTRATGDSVPLATALARHAASAIRAIADSLGLTTSLTRAQATQARGLTDSLPLATTLTATSSGGGNRSLTDTLPLSTSLARSQTAQARALATSIPLTTALARTVTVTRSIGDTIGVATALTSSQAGQTRSLADSIGLATACSAVMVPASAAHLGKVTAGPPRTRWTAGPPRTRWQAGPPRTRWHATIAN